jgi:hypothetical protein
MWLAQNIKRCSYFVCLDFELDFSSDGDNRDILVSIEGSLEMQETFLNKCDIIIILQNKV